MTKRGPSATSQPPRLALRLARTRYPFVACELFCCDIDAVLGALLEDDELLALLFSYVQQPAPLNPLLAGYFGKVAGMLLLRRAPELTRFLEARPAVLAGLVAHIGTTSVAEVLLRLLGADEQLQQPPEATHWLAATPLLESILDCLAPGCSPDTQSNAAVTLAAIARVAPSPLASRLSSPEFVERLLSHAYEPCPAASATHGLDVCAALISTRLPAPLPPPPPRPYVPPAMREAAAAAEASQAQAAERLAEVPIVFSLLWASERGCGRKKEGS